MGWRTWKCELFSFSCFPSLFLLFPLPFLPLLLGPHVSSLCSSHLHIYITFPSQISYVSPASCTISILCLCLPFPFPFLSPWSPLSPVITVYLPIYPFLFLGSWVHIYRRSSAFFSPPSCIDRTLRLGVDFHARNFPFLPVAVAASIDIIDIVMYTMYYV